MIPVETKPVRCDAFQWHQPGDGEGIVVPDPIGGGQHWGMHSYKDGFKRVSAGVWVVVDARDPHNPRVLTNAEFHWGYRIVGEPG